MAAVPGLTRAVGLISKTSSSRVISNTDTVSSPSQISVASQSTLNNGGLILRLGQNTNNKLLNGIFVCWLSLAVARINSATVRMRSLFSTGSWPTRDLKALRSPRDGGRMLLKLGIANVESEGGFRKPCKPLLGPEGSVGPRPPIPS